MPIWTRTILAATIFCLAGCVKTMDTWGSLNASVLDYAVFSGKMTSSIFGNHIELTGTDPSTRATIICSGDFHGNFDAKIVSVPLSCTNGVSGFLKIGRDIGYACYTDGVSLSDGLKGALLTAEDAKNCPVATGS